MTAHSMTTALFWRVFACVALTAVVLLATFAILRNNDSTVTNTYRNCTPTTGWGVGPNPHTPKGC